jgi:hypothetical protein
MSDFELPQTSKGATHGPAKRPVGKPSIDPTTLKGEEPLKEDDSKEVPEYSKEELLRVFDEIIFSEEYSEEYLIRGRIPVSFRTRTAEDINKIQRAIDSAGLNLISSVETMRSIMNLQYSLAAYNKVDLTGMKFEDRTKIIEKLPGPIVGVLINLMARFDRKVALACEEGEKNF